VGGEGLGCGDHDSMVAGPTAPHQGVLAYEDISWVYD
jgi:hypothetical protein